LPAAARTDGGGGCLHVQATTKIFDAANQLDCGIGRSMCLNRRWIGHDQDRDGAARSVCGGRVQGIMGDKHRKVIWSPHRGSGKETPSLLPRRSQGGVVLRTTCAFGSAIVPIICGEEIMKKTMATIVAALALTAGLAAHAPAQEWPQKSIRLIVPFGPGGGADIIGRIIAQSLQEKLGQPVVIENRPGAGGTLGNEAVARADKDGPPVRSSRPS
jgi:hypothetical protein